MALRIQNNHDIGIEKPPDLRSDGRINTDPANSSRTLGVVMSKAIAAQSSTKVKFDFNPYFKEPRTMTSRPFPSYWMYKDNQNMWRWRYDASNGRTISVSSESYHNRTDCERSIEIMMQSYNSPTWLPTDLANAA